MQLPPVDRSIPLPSAAESTPGVGAVASVQAVQTGVSLEAQDTRGHTDPAQGTGVQAAHGAQGAGGTYSTADAKSEGADGNGTTGQKKEKAPQIPPPEPIYKMLMDQIQSMWRASTQAVNPSAQAEAQRQAMQQVGSENTYQAGPLVYTDPSKVKRPPSSSSV